MQFSFSHIPIPDTTTFDPGTLSPWWWCKTDPGSTWPRNVGTIYDLGSNGNNFTCQVGSGASRNAINSYCAAPLVVNSSYREQATSGAFLTDNSTDWTIFFLQYINSGGDGFVFTTTHIDSKAGTTGNNGLIMLVNGDQMQLSFMPSGTGGDSSATISNDQWIVHGARYKKSTTTLTQFVGTANGDGGDVVMTPNAGQDELPNIGGIYDTKKSHQAGGSLGRMREWMCFKSYLSDANLFTNIITKYINPKYGTSF